MIVLPGLGSTTGAGDGESGGSVRAIDVSCAVDEPDSDAARLVEPAPQPGSNGSTSQAIVKITAEQIRAARDRERRRCLMDRILLRLTALRRRIRFHRASLYFCICRPRKLFCNEMKRDRRTLVLTVSNKSFVGGWVKQFRRSPWPSSRG